MTASFSPSCLRNVRTSVSSSRMLCCSRLRRLACPIWIPDAFSQLRSVSIQIPSSLATSVGCRPCSLTKRAAPVLNSSSYRGGGVPFLAFFSSIFFAPFLSSLRLVVVYTEFCGVSQRAVQQRDHSIDNGIYRHQIDSFLLAHFPFASRPRFH